MISANAWLTGSAKAGKDYTPRYQNDPASLETFDRGARQKAVTILLRDNDIYDGYSARQFYVYLPNGENVDPYSHTMRIRIVDNGMFRIF